MYDKFLNRFLAALYIKDFATCQEIQQELLMIAATEPSAGAWCLYLEGILANERDRDWASGERLFLQVLDRPIDADLRGRTLRALGNAYDYQARWQAALDAYQQSLALFGAPEQQVERAKLLALMAIVLRRGYTHGNFPSEALHQAVAHCQQAQKELAANKAASSVPETLVWLEGAIWNTLGALYKELGDLDQAQTCYQRDLDLARQQQDQHGSGISYLNLGEVYQKMGEPTWPQALAAYNLALDIFRQYRDLYNEIDALANLASLYQAMGQGQPALSHYQLALARVEDLRAGLTAGEVRTSFLATMLNLYARTVHLLVDTGQAAQAFDIVERARSRTFIELLANRSLRAPVGVDPVLLAQEQELRHTLQSLYGEASQNGGLIDQREAELSALLRQMALQNSAYVDLRVVQTLTHDQIQARLPPQVAMVAYFATAERFVAFVITRERLRGHWLSLTLPELQHAAFTEDGRLRGIDPAFDLNRQLRLHKPWRLERLYERLILPIQPDLQGKSTLYLIPHGLLYYVPFHALGYQQADGQVRTLLDDYELLYGPSATVLLEYCRYHPAPGQERGMALGYNGQRLHYAEEEARTIAQVIGGAPYTDEAATSATLVQQSTNHRYIHIACHSQFNPQAPMLSHLLLADGPLYAHDILQNLQITAELVTLSACETGRSQIVKGDELLGLVRSLIYAGAPAVLVSLWAVDEISTLVLMNLFYRELAQSRSKASALRTAQQQLRSLTVQQVITILERLGRPNAAQEVHNLASLSLPPDTALQALPEHLLFAHPYFWAPFILMGDQI